MRWAKRPHTCRHNCTVTDLALYGLQQWRYNTNPKSIHNLTNLNPNSNTTDPGNTNRTKPGP